MLLIVEKSLKAVETLHEPFGRGRNKRSIPGPGSSDPVLCPAKLTGHLVGSPSAPQQNCVDLPNQAQRERKSLAQAFQTMLHGGDVVRNFLHVLDGDVRYLIVLKQEQVGERGLSAFDLRGDQGLLTNIQIMEESGVG
jgi:hypothetical protein